MSISAGAPSCEANRLACRSHKYESIPSRALRLKEMLYRADHASIPSSAKWGLVTFLNAPQSLTAGIDLLKPSRKAQRTIEKQRGPFAPAKYRNPTTSESQRSTISSKRHNQGQGTQKQRHLYQHHLLTGHIHTKFLQIQLITPRTEAMAPSSAALACRPSRYKIHPNLLDSPKSAFSPVI